jgi:phage-related protein
MESVGGSVGKSIGNGLMGSIASIAKIVAGALATKAVLDFGRAAVDSYADFEQLAGGVETLFGDAAPTVMANAQRAFESAGLSANDYMETVTSFSASLLQSLGQDTVEAARYADMAITDMSDNANKMGTDMASIQNAYQGFAKQNYTMLDNLKLGYGGTKSEMERLLADAEAISGIHYDISNYADVVEAIHVIQTEMGITGTTAAEAASTISGSWGMLTASWSNLLTSIAGGGDELDIAIQNVFDSLGTYLGNLVPRIVEVARNIFASIPIAAEKALEALPTVITEIVRSAFGDAAADSVGSFLTTLQEKLSAVQEFFEPLADAASEALGSIADLGGDVITALAPLGDFVTGNGPAFAGMMERIQQHLADLGPVVDTLSATWDVLKETFTNFVSVVSPIIAEFLGQLISGIVGLLPIIASVVEAVATVINDILVILTAFISDAQNGFEGLRSTLAGIWDSIKGKVTEVWEGIKTTITNVWNSIKTGVSTAVNNVKATVSNVFNSIKSTVSSIWNGIKSAITTPINAARDAVSNAIGRIKSLFNFTIRWPHIPLPHFSVSGSANPLDWLTGGLPKFSISWYAKGGIAERPTLYAAGIGEAGPEAIMPLRGSKMRPFALAVADEMGGAGTVTNYYIDGSAVAADAQLAAALEIVAQRVSGRQRMGTVR